MSRNVRAVRVEWGPHASLIMDPDKFDDLVETVFGKEFTYEWNAADEVFKLWVVDGQGFLDCVRDCDSGETVSGLSESVQDDAMACLENLKALEEEWRGFIDKNGALEVWVDGH